MNFVSLVLALSKSAEIFTKEDENLLWEAKSTGNGEFKVTFVCCFLSKWKKSVPQRWRRAQKSTKVTYTQKIRRYGTNASEYIATVNKDYYVHAILK